MFLGLLNLELKEKWRKEMCVVKVLVSVYKDTYMFSFRLLTCKHKKRNMETGIEGAPTYSQGHHKNHVQMS